MQNYNFKTKPFKHQANALNESWAAEYYALFMEMGTGKSKVAIDNIGLLYEQGELDAALVIAPKGVYDNWVKGEFPAHQPEKHQAQHRSLGSKDHKNLHGYARRVSHGRL